MNTDTDLWVGLVMSLFGNRLWVSVPWYDDVSWTYVYRCNH